MRTAKKEGKLQAGNRMGEESQKPEKKAAVPEKEAAGGEASEKETAKAAKPEEAGGEASEKETAGAVKPEEETAGGADSEEKETAQAAAQDFTEVVAEIVESDEEPPESKNGIRDVEPLETKASIRDAEPDLSDIEVKNPRIGRVLSLKEEAERQNALERQRGRRIRQEQEYIDKMLTSVETNLRNTKEEQKYNEEFERHIREQVYRMHGISGDKLFGMTEARRAWYQGAAFALFFLSLVLIVLCGVLHGFGSEICIFMAFYTAIEGALLSNGRKQSVVFDVLIRVLYLLLFPTMMVAFVCYELGFAEYEFLVPIFTVAGVVVLMTGAVSYFVYDPYRVDRRNQKKADGYIREMEKTALKEVRLKEKVFEKQEKKRERQARKEEKKQKRAEGGKI